MRVNGSDVWAERCLGLLLCGVAGLGLLPEAWAQSAVVPLPVTPGSQTPGLQTPGATLHESAESGGGGAEILSDTRGVDFQPYLHGLLQQIYTHWASLMPEEARKPTLAQGESDIRFRLRPNGEIASMVLDASARNEALDKAAWGAIAGAGPFAPLPEAFTGPYLEVRLHFRVNLPQPPNR